MDFGHGILALLPLLLSVAMIQSAFLIQGGLNLMRLVPVHAYLELKWINFIQFSLRYSVAVLVLFIWSPECYLKLWTEQFLAINYAMLTNQHCYAHGRVWNLSASWEAKDATPPC